MCIYFKILLRRPVVIIHLVGHCRMPAQKFFKSSCMCYFNFCKSFIFKTLIGSLEKQHGNTSMVEMFAQRPFVFDRTKASLFISLPMKGRHQTAPDFIGSKMNSKKVDFLKSTNFILFVQFFSRNIFPTMALL